MKLFPWAEYLLAMWYIPLNLDLYNNRRLHTGKLTETEEWEQPSKS